jgi:hypothetical protein
MARSPVRPITISRSAYGLAIIADFFLDAYIAMLLIGALHHHVPAVPAFSYALTTVFLCLARLASYHAPRYDSLP